MSGLLLDGKIIFITGAATGIGWECAKAYADAGAVVVVADIDPDGAERASREIGRGAIAIRCDVGDAASVEAAAAETLDRLGRIDALHNNAGMASPSKPLHTTTEHEWDALYRINVKSIFLTTRAFFETLKQNKGSILNTASLVGLIGQADHAAYVASKGAVISLTKAMALDYAPDGIRVNAICPAGVWTPMVRRWAAEQDDPAEVEKYLDQIHALGYCPKGDVVADAAVFLLSDKARFLTGCILPVSGGAELGYKR